MNIQTVVEAMFDAKRIHNDINEEISMDALFVAAYLERVGGKKTRPYVLKRKEAAPDGLEEFISSIAGSSVSASQVWLGFTSEQPTAAHAKKMGGWLRELGYEPRKTNGRVVFDV